MHLKKTQVERWLLASPPSSVPVVPLRKTLTLEGIIWIRPFHGELARLKAHKVRAMHTSLSIPAFEGIYTNTPKKPNE